MTVPVQPPLLFREAALSGKRKLESGSLGVGSIVWAKRTDDVVAIDDDNYAATIEAVDNDAKISSSPTPMRLWSGSSNLGSCPNIRSRWAT